MTFKNLFSLIHCNSDRQFRLNIVKTETTCEVEAIRIDRTDLNESTFNRMLPRCVYVYV